MVGAGVLSLPSAMANLGWYVSLFRHSPDAKSFIFSSVLLFYKLSVKKWFKRVAKGESLLLYGVKERRTGGW